MSADNWTRCPKCNQKRKETLKKYGEIPEEEYLSALHPTDEDKTPMREDWEIGMSDSGEFYLYYSCKCTRCGFNWKYQYEDHVLI